MTKAIDDAGAWPRVYILHVAPSFATKDAEWDAAALAYLTAKDLFFLAVQPCPPLSVNVSRIANASHVWRVWEGYVAARKRLMALDPPTAKELANQLRLLAETQYLADPLKVAAGKRKRTPTDAERQIADLWLGAIATARTERRAKRASR